MKKISYLRFGEFIVEYHCGLHENQRVGQAFINNFSPQTDVDMRLFYMTKDNEAWHTIMEHYVCDSTSEDSVEVQKEISGVCQYNVGCGWSDAICGKDLPCKEHDNLICSHEGCDLPAKAGCDNAGSLVCGMPVCGSKHMHCGRHGW